MREYTNIRSVQNNQNNNHKNTCKDMPHYGMLLLRVLTLNSLREIHIYIYFFSSYFLYFLSHPELMKLTYSILVTQKSRHRIITVIQCDNRSNTD